MFGHIHKPQIIDGKVFYSGPIERLSFNEQDIQPGFWIHEVALQANPVRISLPVVEYKKELNSEFIETPARRYVTLECPKKQYRDLSMVNSNSAEQLSKNLSFASTTPALKKPLNSLTVNSLRSPCMTQERSS